MSISNSTGAKIQWNLKPTSKLATKSLGNLVIARGPDDDKSLG